MLICDAIYNFDRERPGWHRELMRICTALRGNGIHTLEQLMEIYRLVPGQLLEIRRIGPQCMQLIGALIAFYRSGQERR